MIGIALAALAIAGASPSPEVTFPIPGPHGVELMALCARANDGSMDTSDPSKALEIFVGRLEIDMSQNDFTDKDKDITRILCRAYQSGYTAGLQYSVRIFGEVQKKSNPH